MRTSVEHPLDVFHVRIRKAFMVLAFVVSVLFMCATTALAIDIPTLLGLVVVDM